jgi:hypothetical protein
MHYFSVKRFLLLITFILSSLLLRSQAMEKQLREVIQLIVPREGGGNGAGVAWHPIQKKYYSAIAGNTSYSLGVYDVNGKLISPDKQETLFDVRGIWYNPTTEKLQMNGYKDFGWAEYLLNAQGLPSSVHKLHAGMNQPDLNSVGAYDYKENLVYFLNEVGMVEVFEANTAKYQRQFSLKYLIEEGKGSYENDVLNEYTFHDQYNTTLVYTGLMGAELGVLNIYTDRIELYSLKTGYLKEKLLLPKGTATRNTLNFSFANGTYFLFDQDKRIWRGYK